MKLETKTEFVVAATEKDGHGHKLTETDLQKNADMVNKNEFAGPYRIMHDRSIAPRGKVIAARVNSEDGKLLLYNTAAPFTASGTKLELSDQTILFEEVCDEDHRPPLGFGVAGGFSDAYRIHVDPMNFGARADFEAFNKEVGTDAALTTSVRKGLGAEALLVFLIAKIGEKLMDKVGDKSADAILEAIQKIWKKSAESFKTHKKKDLALNQNVILDYSPIIELHCHSDDPEIMCSAFTTEALKTMLSTADECKDKMKAARVHFKWINDSWKIHYVQTEDGRQFLTDFAQKEREEAETKLLEYIEKNDLSGGHSIDIQVKEPWAEK